MVSIRLVEALRFSGIAQSELVEEVGWAKAPCDALEIPRYRFRRRAHHKFLAYKRKKTPGQEDAMGTAPDSPAITTNTQYGAFAHPTSRMLHRSEAMLR
uniref:Uncharacterized protein n=1 Tax=Candidatus Kentrum sp. FW TaxID=2126338 RepID=A0A450TM10_9GAMM|nr:MAG: hypothetical protein BECKFW1821C_GA0114237_10165 [Candidatus Kentron sp. FW]